MGEDPCSRSKGSTVELPLHGPSITEHDRAHASTYLRLLDGEAAGLAWQDAAAQVLGLDVAADPGAAKIIYDAYLERARWMTKTGYRLFIGQK